MALLIDGYNVLHCTHVLPDRWSEVGVVGLCRLIDRAGPRGGARVVCDGAPPAAASLGACEGGLRQSIGAVKLIFAGGGHDADPLIESMIEEEAAPRQLMVVSNDRRLQVAARRRGAGIVSSEEFLRRLAGALRPRSGRADAKPTSEPEVDAWMQRFGFDENCGTPAELDSETSYWLREFGFEDEK